MGVDHEEMIAVNDVESALSPDRQEEREMSALTAVSPSFHSFILSSSFFSPSLF